MRNRNTPAYAGRTTKYPESKVVLTETPPLTRGGRTPFSPAGGFERKHPRLRGEDPHPSLFTRQVGQKHPRLRGEDTARRSCSVVLIETPPLTRGGRVQYGSKFEETGNTPAYAGRTISEPELADRQGNTHAYAGRTMSATSSFRSSMETPPLTRGGLGRFLEDRLIWGNTPAYAGRTKMLKSRSSLSRKHPRLRGEDYVAMQNAVSRVGNTPAYAGRTTSR